MTSEQQSPGTEGALGPWNFLLKGEKENGRFAEVTETHFRGGRYGATASVKEHSGTACASRTLKFDVLSEDEKENGYETALVTTISRGVSIARIKVYDREGNFVRAIRTGLDAPVPVSRIGVQNNTGGNVSNFF